MKDSEFYTATMANLYAQQGHFKKAAEIYRFILSKEPDRADIAESLNRVEQELTASESKPKDLADLFKAWFQLADKYRRIQSLKKLKQDLLS